MSADEFSLIQRYFSKIGTTSENCQLGVGDDAAVVEVPAGQQLVVCMDTLIAGVHFPEKTSAADIACKSLVVNLSDLAAMAAVPDWFLLSLSLPEADEVWLAEFAASLHETAVDHGIDLVGGDTCRGPLSISIQAAGLVPVDAYIERKTATIGDLIVVSGNLGEAALGLACTEGRVALDDDIAASCLAKLNRPHPRLELREFLQQHASAAIDISDGLVADLQHILEQSNCGALVDLSRLPCLPWFRDNGCLDYVLYGGDDYEICCTVPAKGENEIYRWNSENQDCQLSIIGEITESGFSFIQGTERIELNSNRGFRHFE